MEKKAQKKQMMKQRYITVFIMLILLVFSAFAAEFLGRTTHRYNVRRDLSVYFSNADSVIESIRNSLHRRDWRITINYKSHGDNMEDIPDLVRDLMSFAVDETDDPAEGDYIFHQYGGYEMKYSYQPDGNRYYYSISIIPDYYTTPEQEDKVSSEINSIIEDFGFDDDTSDYEKVRAIYDFVIDRTDYDEIHKKNENYHLKATAFGALIYGKAVCQGYSVLMYRILREAGIDSRVITGTALYEDGEEFHAWNIVKIDDKYYNLDVTWDDQEGEENYFLKNDAEFTSHIRDPQFASDDFYSRYPMTEKSY